MIFIGIRRETGGEYYETFYQKTDDYVVVNKGGRIVSLMAEETYMVDAEYIDSVSEIIDEKQERLIEEKDVDLDRMNVINVCGKE